MQSPTKSFFPGGSLHCFGPELKASSIPPRGSMGETSKSSCPSALLATLLPEGPSVLDPATRCLRDKFVQRMSHSTTTTTLLLLLSCRVVVPRKEVGRRPAEAAGDPPGGCRPDCQGQRARCAGRLGSRQGEKKRSRCQSQSNYN